jgi:hypothetical protein
LLSPNASVLRRRIRGQVRMVADMLTLCMYKRSGLWRYRSCIDEILNVVQLCSSFIFYEIRVCPHRGPNFPNPLASLLAAEKENAP